MALQDYTDSVIVLPVRDGQVCLAERLPGTRMAGQYVTPGGGINRRGSEAEKEGEPVDATIPAAALREYREETGDETAEESDFVYLGKLEAEGEDRWPIGGHFFLLRVKPDVELKQTEPDMQGPWKWYGFREAAQLPLPPVSRSLIHLLAHALGVG